jgi:flagellar biosynthetic protein FliR
VPFSRTLTSDDFLPELSDTLSQAYVLALRITSPFLLFSLIINLGFGFLARLIPQAPIYFISAPFLIVAGLYSVYLISNDFIAAFLNQFGSWVRHG